MGELISNLPAASGANLGDLLPSTQGSTGPGSGTTRKWTVAQLITLLSTQGFLMANTPVPPDSGNYTTASVALTDTYGPVLSATGSARKLLIMQAGNQGVAVLIQFGGDEAPSDDAGAYFLAPNDTWPPAAAANLVSNDAVWARTFSGTANLSVITA